jgi:hypothetical protein
VRVQGTLDFADPLRAREAPLTPAACQQCARPYDGAPGWSSAPAVVMPGDYWLRLGCCGDCRRRLGLAPVAGAGEPAGGEA